MTRLRLLAFAFCAVAAAAASADDKDDKKPMKLDPAKLVGSYKIVGGSKGGEKLDPEVLKDPVTFTKDRITLKSKDMQYAFKYKIEDGDETKDKAPTLILMEIVEPEGLKGKKSKGIIKMDGAKVMLAYDYKGGPPPKEFKSKEDSDVFVFELERAKGKGKGKGGKKNKDKDKNDGAE